MRIRRVAQGENVLVEGFVGDEVARLHRITIGQAVGLDVVVFGRSDRSVLGGHRSYILEDGAIRHTGHAGTFRVDGTRFDSGHATLRDGARALLLDLADESVALAFDVYEL